MGPRTSQVLNSTMNFVIVQIALMSQVARSDSQFVVDNIDICSYSFNKYILEPYFEKYESFVESNFQDFADALHGCSCELLPNKTRHFGRAVSNRLLIGEGSHRHLHSSIKFNFHTEAISQQPSFSMCKVIVLERLPSGVFADTFELQHLRQHGFFTDAAVFGDTNLERPTVASNQSVVEVHMNIYPLIFFGQTNELEVSIDLPLHARYPPLGESGYFEIEFGGSDLLMNCNKEGNPSEQSCLFTPSVVNLESRNSTILWRIPSGTRTHAGMVSLLTYLAAFLSTMSIVVASLFCSDINCAKTSKLS